MKMFESRRHCSSCDANTACVMGIVLLFGSGLTFWWLLLVAIYQCSSKAQPSASHNERTDNIKSSGSIVNL
jgi:hypothetical protein